MHNNSLINNTDEYIYSSFMYIGLAHSSIHTFTPFPLHTDMYYRYTHEHKLNSKNNDSNKIKRYQARAIM